ncbi:MAG: porin [Proteobacteria bacterium]|nr:porin [Pseudomonadota bacterium]
MKLKQIALAAAVVAASSAALADVTIYGIADVNLNNGKTETGFDGEAATATSTSQGRIGSGGLSTSRIGFKGSEDLGGGMQASFQLEGKLNIDTGKNDQYDGGFFGRQSWVGLTGNFGTVQLGKTWTSYDGVKGKFEHADNTNVGVTGDVWGTGHAYDSNVSNQIKYTLPLSGGLTASLGYAFGENKTATAAAKDLTSLGVTYESGPLAVGYGYQNEAQNTVKDSTFNVVGASYDLGAAKLVASWSQSSYNTGSLVNAAGKSTALKTVGTETGDAKDKEYQLGVKFPMGASNLYFGYANSKVNVAGTERAKANGYVLAATYSLSKRTTAYAGYTTAKRTRNIGLAGQASGRKDTSTFGVRHAF